MLGYLALFHLVIWSSLPPSLSTRSILYFPPCKVVLFCRCCICLFYLYKEPQGFCLTEIPEETDKNLERNRCLCPFKTFVDISQRILRLKSTNHLTGVNEPFDSMSTSRFIWILGGIFRWGGARRKSRAPFLLSRCSRGVEKVSLGLPRGRSRPGGCGG